MIRMMSPSKSIPFNLCATRLFTFTIATLVRCPHHFRISGSLFCLSTTFSDLQMCGLRVTRYSPSYFTYFACVQNSSGPSTPFTGRPPMCSRKAIISGMANLKHDLMYSFPHFMSSMYFSTSEITYRLIVGSRIMSSFFAMAATYGFSALHLPSTIPRKHLVYSSSPSTILLIQYTLSSARRLKSAYGRSIVCRI